MSVLGIAFFAALGILFVAQLKRGARLRLFGSTSVPLAFVVYFIGTILLWKILAPASISDAHAYGKLGVAETAWVLRR